MQGLPAQLETSLEHEHIVESSRMGYSLSHSLSSSVACMAGLEDMQADEERLEAAS